MHDSVGQYSVAFASLGKTLIEHFGLASIMQKITGSKASVYDSTHLDFLRAIKTSQDSDHENAACIHSADS